MVDPNIERVETVSVRFENYGAFSHADFRACGFVENLVVDLEDDICKRGVGDNDMPGRNKEREIIFRVEYQHQSRLNDKPHLAASSGH